MATIKNQMARIYEAVGCHTQSELAAILGIRQSQVTDAIRRKQIPQDWLEKISYEWGVSPEWILLGELSKQVPQLKSKEKQPKRTRKNFVYTTIICPKCGTPNMRILLDAQGEIFFGCTNYPKCQCKISATAYLLKK